jgi:hypothetical protein
MECVLAISMFVTFALPFGWASEELAKNRVSDNVGGVNDFLSA